MPRYTYPGVYSQERRGAPPPIQGVSASIGAVVGFTREGPLNEPTDVVSYPDFEDKFGSFTSKSLTPTHAYHFFAEGGTAAKVVRVVGDGAVNSSAMSGVPVVGEVLTTDPVFDGSATSFVLVGANALGSLPLAPGTLALKTSVGIGSEDFTDNGDGTLTGSGGGTGTVDYERGELTLNYVVAPAIGLTVSADYSQGTFLFEMLWPGEAGDEFDVVISGDPLFEDETTSTFSRYVVEVRRTEGGITNTIEQFEGLVFDDSTDPNYVVDVINDGLNGSKLIHCVSQGNDENPPALQGSAVTAQALTLAPAYDGTTRLYTYTFATGVAPTTLSASIELPEDNVQVSTGDGTDAPVIALPGAPVGIDEATFQLVVPQTTGAPASETFTSDGIGTGTLTGDAAGTGTLDPATGAVTISMGGADTSLVGAAITASYRYLPHVISDDGAGGVSIDAGGLGPAHWELDSNGANSLAYGTSSDVGVLTLTWRNTLNPAAGPDSGTVAGVETADYTTKAVESEVVLSMTGGDDGGPVTRAQISAATLVGPKEGLYAFNKTDDLLNLSIPDFETDPLVSQDLIAYVETRQDRFGVISAPHGLSPADAISYKKTTLNANSNRVAMYYPHVKTTDPLSGRAVDIPVGGHVLGIYARTDDNRNVSKAPAGTEDGRIRTAIGLERRMGDEDIGQLNPNHICSLADDAQKGRVVWGARTLEQGGEFPYIQMRRLFMFVEKSVSNAMYRHVFESNTPGLRSEMIAQIETFLLGLFNTNHFSGSTPGDAYYVVDKTTATNVSLGIINLEVGLAPTRPAEFILLTFRQKQLSNA